MNWLRKSRVEPGFLLALIIPLIMLSPVLVNADVLFNSADMTVHLHRSHAMTVMMEAGNFYPRWIPYMHMGYGYPIFNFYAPGSVTFTSLLHLGGMPIALAANVTIMLCWIFGAAGVYRLARQFLPVTGALLAVTLWSYAPSLLYEYWWQGSLAQTVSTAILPWLFFFLVRNIRLPNLRDSAWTALAFAGMIYTHTPTMYISALFAGMLAFVLPLWMYRTRKAEVVRGWLYAGIGLAFGIGLAAAFLMPLLAELQYVKIQSGISGTENFLRNQFIIPTELFMLPRPFDVTDITLQIPRTLGLIGGILSAIGIVALLWRRRWGLALLFSAGLLFIIFMTQDILFDVWLLIPGFRNLRYPERLLRMGALLIALAGGSSLLLLPVRWRVVGLLAGVILVIGQALPLVYPPVESQRLGAFSAYDELEMEYVTRAWGTTSYDEFKPAWGNKTPYDMPPSAQSYRENPLQRRVIFRDTDRFADELSVARIDDNTLELALTEPLTIRFRQFYFPGWSVTLNGNPAEIYPDEEWGLIALDVPAGTHLVTLHYTGTMIQQLSIFVSLAFLGIIGGMFWQGRNAPVAPSHVSEPLSRDTGGIIFIGIAGFAVLHLVVLHPAGVFRVESEADNPAYMQSESGVVFGDRIELMGYTLDWQEIAAGQRREITLYWRAVDDITENYRPIVQLVNFSQDAAYAVSEPLFPSGGSTQQMPPDNFMSDTHALMLFPDVPPYVGRLSVQLLSQATGEPLLLPDGSDRVMLDPVIQIHTPNMPGEKALDVKLGDVTELWCAAISERDGQIMIDTTWHLTGTTPEALVLFIHGLDADGTLVEQGDSAFFGGNYPAQYWQPGQTLQDRYTLPANPEITKISLGIYLRSNPAVRLPVSGDDTGAPDSFLLAREENTCSR